MVGICCASPLPGPLRPKSVCILPTFRSEHVTSVVRTKSRSIFTAAASIMPLKITGTNRDVAIYSENYIIKKCFNWNVELLSLNLDTSLTIKIF